MTTYREERLIPIIANIKSMTKAAERIRKSKTIFNNLTEKAILVN